MTIQKHGKFAIKIQLNDGNKVIIFNFGELNETHWFEKDFGIFSIKLWYHIYEAILWINCGLPL